MPPGGGNNALDSVCCAYQPPMDKTQDAKQLKPHSPNVNPRPLSATRSPKDIRGRGLPTNLSLSANSGPFSATSSLKATTGRGLPNSLSSPADSRPLSATGSPEDVGERGLPVALSCHLWPPIYCHTWSHQWR